MEKIYRIFLRQPLHKPNSIIHAVMFWIMLFVTTLLLFL
jgi:hypothetical protein